MKNFIKKLFCKHDHKKQIFREKHIGGKIYRNYGNQCLSCEKKWWL